MSVSMIEFLKHILDEIKFLKNESAQVEFSEFISDEVRKRAFTRSLEIIGEATKQVPDDVRKKHPFVEWREISGMRDILIHAYFGIDYELVWDVVVNEIPQLEVNIKRVIDSESRQ